MQCAGHRSTKKKTTDCCLAQQEVRDKRSGDTDESRRHHVLERASCADGYARIWIGRSETLQKTWDLAELPAHFGNHKHCRRTNCLDEKSREPEWQNRAQEHACDHARIKNVEHWQVHGLRETAEQCQRCQGGGANCKTLPHCRRCVAERIELIRTLSNNRQLSSQFGNSTCVIGNRTIGIDRQRYPKSSEHADSCKSNAIHPESGIGCKQGHRND